MGDLHCAMNTHLELFSVGLEVEPAGEVMA